MTIAQNFPAISPSLLLDFANVQALDSRITFTRATTATYYGTRTALAEQNLFTQSVGMSDWVISNSGAQITRVLNATTAPDSTSTATSIKSVSGNTQASLSSKSTERTFPVNSTISVYAKADGRNFLAINLRSSGGTRSVWFDLINGTVGTAESGNTGQIVNAGNGWYRCIATRTSSDIDQVQFYIADTDGSFAITNNDTIGLFVWGAQAEQRSTVTAYTPTTTQPISNYIPILETAASNVARFDHNPTTFESLGLLIEEQRTNLQTYSEDFANAAWIKSNSTITSNTIVPPDGTLNGDKLVENTATAEHFISKSVAVVSGTTYVLSVFAKQAEPNRFLSLLFGGGGFYSGEAATFNLNTGVVASTNGTTTATITSVGNGWYRCSTTAVSKATGTPSGAERIVLNNSTSSVTFSYTGDGYSGIYIWGAQMEAGAFATSYIPTVASQVTRSADIASMTGTNFSSWYNQGEGTFVTEVIANNSATAGAQIRRFLEIRNDATTEVIRFGRATSNFAIRFVLATNGVVETLTPSAAITFGTIVPNNPDTFAVGYSATIPSLVLDGTKAPDITGGFVGLPTGMTQMNIGSAGVANLTDILNGTIKRVAFYPLRLTNTQLISLTS